MVTDVPTPPEVFERDVIVGTPAAATHSIKKVRRIIIPLILIPLVLLSAVVVILDLVKMNEISPINCEGDEERNKNFFRFKIL